MADVSTFQSLYIHVSVHLRPVLSFFRVSFTIKVIKPLAPAIEHIGTTLFGTLNHVKEENLLL
jgi:hypothetical protein